jgi:hypothetical protein
MFQGNKMFSLGAIVVSVVLLVGALSFYLAQNNPDFFKLPSSSLTPARDLTGTWVSSLAGKGCQLMGQFTIEGTVSTLHENCDIELIIADVSDNIATGTIRYYNLCIYGFATIPNYGKIDIPQNCTADSGPIPIQIKVSSSSLDFGQVQADGITASMNAMFTSDLIHGNMSLMAAGYGEMKGPFNLMRKR